jgi:LmbE family N-acetylglucosaminyl deacetylase
MQQLSLESIQTVLCLGAHADDIEIGCGGTILKLLETHAGLDIRWIVFSAAEDRAREVQHSAEQFLAGAQSLIIETLRFKDSYFPYQGADIKDYFEKIKPNIAPDLIFTHYRHDLHQDHRLISELTWNTFRNHLILEYEVPKWDGDMGAPNVFVPLTEAQYRHKVRYLLDNFQSQAGRPWFCEELFLSLLRLRGMECNAPSGHAEAFYARKISL